MRHIYFLTGVLSLLLILQSCPVKSSLIGSYDGKLEKIIYWSAEFGYNCALAGISREEMQRLLKERKENRK